jgi:hypothetical protein
MYSWQTANLYKALLEDFVIGAIIIDCQSDERRKEMMKRIAAFSLFVLMTAFATQTVTAGGIGIGNQNGNGIHDWQPWHKSGAPSDNGDDSVFKKKPDPDEDDRGPAEEDEGVMVWEKQYSFWRAIEMNHRGF